MPRIADDFSAIRKAMGTLSAPTQEPKVPSSVRLEKFFEPIILSSPEKISIRRAHNPMVIYGHISREVADHIPWDWCSEDEVSAFIQELEWLGYNVARVG